MHTFTLPDLGVYVVLYQITVDVKMKVNCDSNKQKAFLEKNNPFSSFKNTYAN